MKAEQFDIVTFTDDFVAKNKKAFRLTFQKTITKPINVQADAVLIGEALRVLCENAHKYSGAKPVQLQLQKGRGIVRLAIVDQGPGLTAEEKEQVFDRFYRGKEASRKHPNGHGLGLSLAREITERYGGSLVVKSAPAKGSTFTIVLPMSKAETA